MPGNACPVVTGRSARGGGPEGDTTIDASSVPLRPNESQQSSQPGALATRRLLRAGPDGDETSSSTSVYAQHFDPVFGRRFAEHALDALVVVRGAQVLDVACGTGVFARMAAHVVGPAGGSSASTLRLPRWKRPATSM